MSGSGDDPIEIKNPDEIEETVNSLLQALEEPRIKEMDFIHKHFELYNDSRFNKLAEENTFLFNKILKGDFNDTRNREVLILVIKKMREMKDGLKSVFDGEKEILI